MTVASDAELFHAHFSDLGLVPTTAARGYRHMRAVLADAALQPHTSDMRLICWTSSMTRTLRDGDEVRLDRPLKTDVNKKFRNFALATESN